MFGIVPDNRLADVDGTKPSDSPTAVRDESAFSPREQDTAARVDKPHHHATPGAHPLQAPAPVRSSSTTTATAVPMPESPIPRDIHKHVAPDEHNAIIWHRRFIYVLSAVGLAVLLVAIALVVNLATELTTCSEFAASERTLITTAVFNPVRPNAWQVVYPLTPVPPPRFYAAACALGRRMYVVGGITGSTARGIPYDVYKDLWLYAEGTDTWQELAVRGSAPLPTKRYLSSLTDVGGGFLLLYGGFNSHPSVGGHAALGDMFLLDTSTHAWSPLNAATGSAVPAARGGHAAVGIQGSLYMTGGVSSAASGGPQPFHELWSFNVATRVWSSLAMDAGIVTPGGRIMASLGYEPGTMRLFLTGGTCRPSGGTTSVCGGTWMLDRATNAWSMMMATGPPMRTAAAVANGVEGNTIAFSFGGRATAELFTGTEDVACFSDLSALDLTAASWMSMSPNFNRSTSNTPPPTSGHTVVRIGQRIVLFGGQVRSTADPGSSQLWKYQALTPRS